MNWRQVWDGLVGALLIVTLALSLWCVRRCGTLTRDLVEHVSPYMVESRRIDNVHAERLYRLEEQVLP